MEQICILPCTIMMICSDTAVKLNETCIKIGSGFYRLQKMLNITNKSECMT